MLQTLFHIPPDFGPLPIFGFGWALIAWGIFALIWLTMLARNPQMRGELPSAAMLAGIIAAVVMFGMPMLEEITPDTGVNLGVPLRGYGLMLLLAIVAGVGVAILRARRMGIEAEVIFSLAMWMCLLGIVGARLFYVVQKWDTQFQKPTVQETIFALMDFVNGGLVVFGSAIGAILGIMIFCYRRKLPTLAMMDLVVPSMMLGLAIGRIGCLLNGCCYGGVCDAPQLPALRFPLKAPVYQDQLFSGMLFGFRLEARDPKPDGSETLVIAWVDPGSNAEKSGLKAGDVVTGLQGQMQLKNMAEAHAIFHEMPRIAQQDRERGRETAFIVTTPKRMRIEWTIEESLEYSLPVHPTQIYSAIDAFLLFLVLWFYYPLRRHDGEVIALMLTLHPISRFLLEVIRIDEGGALGTPFTISQLVGFLFLAVALGLWIYAYRSPRGSALPLKHAT